MTNEKRYDMANGKTAIAILDDRGNAIVSIDLLDKVIEQINKEYKYRWHDLRKNPDDLPEDYNRVLLHTIRGNDMIAYLDLDMSNWYLDYDDLYAFCEKDSGYAVAWREIEPFEEK